MVENKFPESDSLREGHSNPVCRTGRRDTFFCVAKRKYPKKRPPDSRESPCASRLPGGAGKRAIHCPLPPRFLPEAPRWANPPVKLRCSARLHGEEPRARKNRASDKGKLFLAGFLALLSLRIRIIPAPRSAASKPPPTASIDGTSVRINRHRP